MANFTSIDTLGTIIADGLMTAAARILTSRGDTPATIRVDDLLWGIKSAWRAHQAEVMAEWEKLVAANVSEATTQQFFNAQIVELAQEAVRVYDGW